MSNTRARLSAVLLMLGRATWYQLMLAQGSNQKSWQPNTLVLLTCFGKNTNESSRKIINYVNDMIKQIIDIDVKILNLYQFSTFQ
jgi:hypothetical protein